MTSTELAEGRRLMLALSDRRASGAFDDHRLAARPSRRSPRHSRSSDRGLQHSRRLHLPELPRGQRVLAGLRGRVRCPRFRECAPHRYREVGDMKRIGVTRWDLGWEG